MTNKLPPAFSNVINAQGALIKHVYLSDKRYDEISNTIYSSYPNACIIEILEVTVNPELSEKFYNHLDYMKQKWKDTKILNLFHGTSELGMWDIISNGFDITRNRVSAYGVGSYFSNSTIEANNYAKRHLKNIRADLSLVVLADVVYSKEGSKVGSSYYTDPNNKKYSDAILSQKEIPEGNFLTCYVNNKDKPTYYCIPYDFGAVPRYIIKFHESV